ncbi:hypothetical protein SG34_001855 [Thalassomonas viridans]|uniref:Uncharacterized protein n=1 Tax=Thalassomonas viridans TaxID=137584 RepID=A0AAE9Z442_9GAMM|nr:hypothetical protein [Thalassomonas viridans]WDE05704.1 hypothetical protein SG34_001855 [Thalassomonas viridans]
MSNYLKIKSAALENVNLPGSFYIYQNQPLTDLDFSEPEFERYGGRGLNAHGGGARAANYGRYQVKGVGLTPLAGTIEGYNYSHGTVPLEEAIFEAVYSEVLANVLPVGVAQFYGVIYTGKDTAYEFNENRQQPLTSTHGALFIREKCTRPAHFLRASRFKVRPEYQAEVVPDVERVRKVVKNLAEDFESHDQFIEYVAEFLQGCAEQFGFARVAGITHGAMTPSNILMDGRWLDLVTPTFVDRGRNYRIANLTFYNEASIAIEVSQELCDTYGKFNNVSFDTSALHDYYRSSLEFSVDYHLPYIFGIDRDAAASMDDCDKTAALYDRFKSVFRQESKVYFTKYLDDDTSRKFSDDLIALIEPAQYDGSSAEAMIYQAAYEYFPHKDTVSLKGFIGICLIKALKRDLLARLYYRNRVTTGVQQVSQQAKPEEVEGLIQAYKNSSLWVFDDNLNEQEVIYQSTDGKEVIAFDGRNRKITIKTVGSELEVDELSAFDATQLPCSFFKANQQVFTEYLEKVNQVVRKLHDEQ